MIRAKKALGQHFLAAESAAQALASAAEISAGEKVLEIGPGTGILTAALLAQGAEVTAVEKDRELLPLLRERFARAITSRHLHLVEGDIADFDPATLGGYRIAANIPYYLTGDILRRFLSGEVQPRSMTLLVQKEVADRILARDEKESLLSLSVKSYGKPLFIKKVPAGSFVPPPKVDSAIIHIKNVSREFFQDIDEGEFFKMLRAGFGHKRKQLAGNLSGLYGRDKTERALEEAGKPARIRAEDLSLADWKELSRRLAAKD